MTQSIPAEQDIRRLGVPLTEADIEELGVAAKSYRRSCPQQAAVYIIRGIKADLKKLQKQKEAA